MPVTLHWQHWSRTQGWTDHPSVTEARIASPGIWPEQAAGAPLLALPLPDTSQPGQWALHAERAWVRPADGAPLTLRSNPLLISLSAA